MEPLQRKKLIIKHLIVALVLLAQSATAQKDFLKKLVPDEANLQYAGSIGFLSGGFGYQLFNEKSDLNFSIGYVPESLGGRLTILSVKFDYKPWKINIKDKAVWHPFNPVIFPSYTLGENFDYEFEAPQYRKGYYFWSSALRLHLGASTEVKLLNLPRGSKIKGLSVYAEANTNDLYAVSWFQNKGFTNFVKMFKVGYGTRIYF
jgi:hypothetical protein